MVDDGAAKVSGPTKLRHSFNHEHAWHYWPIREVSRELRFVRSHAFNPHSSLAGFPLDHPVDQQERIAMGQNLGYLVAAEDSLSGNIFHGEFLRTVPLLRRYFSSTIRLGQHAHASAGECSWSRAQLKAADD